MPSSYATVRAWRERMWLDRRCVDCAADLEDGNGASRCRTHLDARAKRERDRRAAS